MCTVSCLHNANGYELFCNRDERKTRPAAWPPRVRELHGVRFIAPIDAQHGGSWIAVNEFGTTFCLLNRYDVAVASGNKTSRGLLLYDLLDCTAQAEVEVRLKRLSLASFQPFTLATVPLHAPVQLFQWNGSQLQIEANVALPLTSSSFDTQNVIAQRQAAYKTIQPVISRELLLNFHRSHEPLKLEAAVCMHRAETQTVSFSHLIVTPHRIEFRYSPNPPCRATERDTYRASLSTS
jgi:Transport and Golgi organisation 2